MENTQELTIIDKSADILRTGGAVLQNNISIVAKAEMVGRKILAEIQDAGGINTPELDKRCNDFIARCKQRKSEINEDRKGITQIIDEIKKAFTEQEAKLDPTKDGTIPNQLQAHRNAYVKRIAEEEKARKEEAERQAKLQQERIDLKAKFDVELAQYFETHLLIKKQNIQSEFNACNLDSLSKFENKIKGYQPYYENSHLVEFKPTSKSHTLDDKEVEAIKLSSMAGKYTEFNERFTNELNSFKQEIIDKIPSKRTELFDLEVARQKAEEEEKKRQIEIAKADGERKARLEEEARQAKIAEEERLAKQKAEQEQREKAEAERIKAETAEAQRQAELKAQMDKEAELTQSLFDKEIAIQGSVSAPETRTGYKIVITHQAGFAQIFMFWWENEGVKLPLDKIENTKISQMVSYCEKYAHKYNSKIESQYVKYEDDYTAINRKAK
jgi:hypothetical protein